MHFTLKNGVAIYGGFAGNEDPTNFNLDDRDFEGNETILSGHFWEPHWQPALHFHTYHVFFHPEGTDLDKTAVLDGFTITGGKADGEKPHNQGGGMKNTDCNITLTNVTISGNETSGYGGGILNHSSNPRLTNVTISGNTAPNGGGIYNQFSDPTLTNVTISGNTASNGGGIFNTLGSSPTLTNVTISENFASQGRGIFNYSSSPTITNSIFWGNDGSGQEIYNMQGSSPTVNWSIVEGGYQGGTNIFTDDPLLQPLADNGGFTKTHAIPRNSPAYAIPKDAGDGNWNGAPDTDQRGYRRAPGGFRAMGAYEDSSLVQPGVLMLLLDDE